MSAERTGTSRIEPWPVGLALALAAVLGVLTSFGVAASLHPDPLVVADPYEAGRRINDQIRADRAARALGVDLEVAVSPGADAGVAVQVRAHGRDGRPVAVESVRVLRERPAEGSLDRVFELAPTRDLFSGQIPLPRSGRWRLVVTAIVDGHEIREIHGLGG